MLGQNVIQQGRLARPEESREDRHRHAAVVLRREFGHLQSIAFLGGVGVCVRGVVVRLAVLRHVRRHL